MFKSFTLNFSETGKINLPANGITIFVGPNNSGKSLILKEIEVALEHGAFPPGLKILEDFDIIWPTNEALETIIHLVKSEKKNQHLADHLTFSRIRAAGNYEESVVHEKGLRDVVGKRINKGWYAQQILRMGTIRLDGRSRFDLTNDQPAGDLLAPAQNTLTHLFQDDESRLKVRELLLDAFDLTFVIDPTHLGQMRIRLSDEPVPIEEQSLDIRAREFYEKALHIKDASDGVQAYTGILTAVLSSEFHTAFIDEPEAFLHPPLARKLGKHLATISKERDGALLASTHSADFLMGCIQANTNVRVVRLEYSKGKSRARMIDATELGGLLKRPLMRSANVISGLFHDGVIVTESDNDRSFYSEIYYRISQNNPSYPSILFINAQNKQTIRDIIGPLREFGVPAAAITDIDFVKDGGQTWTDWAKSIHLPQAMHLPLGQLRANINNAFTDTGKNMKTEGGVNILNAEDKLAADNFFTQLQNHGLFVVPHGELENWLPQLGVAGKKTDWTVGMLEKLGSDPASDEYVHPWDDDVWSFIESIVNWIRDSSRKGTN
ncbi:ATP-dependent nuclease [Ochrobactrum quorumnocens]|uniref:ATP-dependent nuclease n=1 Tax=Ochrobactrum quorumnocens TaxID=271865 RepID=UPI003B9E53DE